MRIFSHNTTKTQQEVNDLYSVKPKKHNRNEDDEEKKKKKKKGEENIALAVKIGDPKPTDKFSAKELKKMGLKGVYQTRHLSVSGIRIMHTI